MELLDKLVRLEKEASLFGLQWETTDQIITQIQSECEEINEHLEEEITQTNRAELQEEIGDLMHAVFSLCVFCDLNPKDTLIKTLDKFERRLNAVRIISSEKGLPNLQGLSFNEIMAIWQEAKARVD